MKYRYIPQRGLGHFIHGPKLSNIGFYLRTLTTIPTPYPRSSIDGLGWY